MNTAQQKATRSLGSEHWQSHLCLDLGVPEKACRSKLVDPAPVPQYLAQPQVIGGVCVRTR